MKTKLTPRMDPRRQRRRGFTLTEIAIVLGIIGLILGAIWVAAAAVYNNLRVSHANTAVLQIAQAVRGLYANTNTDVGLTAAVLISSKAVPKDLVNNAGTGFINPFPAGVLTVTPNADGLGFMIAMTGLDQASCIAMLMSVGGTTRDPGLYMAQGAVGAIGAPAVTPVPVSIPPAAVPTPTLAVGAYVAANQFGGCAAGLATYAVSFGFVLKS